MENKLPKLFKKDVSKEHNTNNKICITSNKDETVNKKDDVLTVEEKIKKLFKSNNLEQDIVKLKMTKGYDRIFNFIKTKKKDYDTKIIGKIKNSLITEKEEVIPIVEIEDIIIKDH